jgi:hypothetical protein
MSEIFNELRIKLSIDELYISLNALELFTRSTEEHGPNSLKKAISDLVNDCVQRQNMQ